MNWASLSDFIHMGKHGAYVWASYGLALAVVVWELMQLRQRRSAAWRAAQQQALLNDADHDA